MKKLHKISNIEFSNKEMSFNIDGKEYVVDIKDVSPRLWNASAKERAVYSISPSGYGIHWPLIDEDLSVDALIAKIKVKKAISSRLKKLKLLHK